MNFDVVIDKLPIILMLLVVFVYVVYRGRRNRQTLTWTIAYAHYAEAADDVSLELRGVFGDMVPNNTNGVMLLRISLINRGEATAEPDDFLSPIVVTLPEESRVLDAVASEDYGAVQINDITVTSKLNQVEIQPFRLSYRSSVIFNIVVDGPAEPLVMDGALKSQPELNLLQ